MDRATPVKPADARRGLPAVDVLIREMSRGSVRLPDWAVRAGARRALTRAREALLRSPGAPPALGDLAADAAGIAAQLARPHPDRVVNATGVVLHTNLGRAPLAEGAARAVAAAATHYTDLELEREGGGRGDRLAAVAEKLVLLSGADAALTVNNNAAALLLALAALARGREAIVSRGELVEIGGSFRIPEILAQAGVRLVEVGTTNRTHAEDYRRALGPDTAVILKVHRSNFELRGFVAEVELPELAEISREGGLTLVEDLGSGTLVDLSAHGVPRESFAPARLALGADLVCFSGDKLLGGPQAGIALGSREAVARMRREPLARALRLDKLSLAALDWTLGCLLEGRGEAELPALRQLLADPAALASRAAALAARLREVASACGARIAIEVERDVAPVGGGSLPGFEQESAVVALRDARGAQVLLRALREAPLPVVARVRDDAVVVDVRTLLPDEDAAVERALAHALSAGSGD
jgi:L-seryl-tRNA(Ser) seleniumtransferase